MTKRDAFDLSVYFVLDPSVCGGRLLQDVAVEAARGGVTMIQLRSKSDALDIVEQQAIAVQHALVGFDIPFIINDHVDLARRINADGVHIGQDDMSPAQAREIIGNDKILGLTAFTREHYAAIDPNIVDYAGTGPFYATLTKPDKPVLGAEGFNALLPYAPVPVVGIGGITPENTSQVMGCGVNGVAMMRAISEAEDVCGAAQEFVNIVKQARGQAA